MALAAFAALWWLPFILPLAQPPLKHFHAEWLAAMLGLVAVAALVAARDVRPVIPTSAALLGVFAIFCAVQPLFVAMAYSTPSQSYAIYLFWAASMAAAAATLRRHLGTEPVLKSLAWAALFGGALSAMLGMLQKYGPPEALTLLAFDHLKDKSAQGNAGHANYFGDVLLFGVAGASYLFARSRLSWLSLVPILLLLTYAIALSGSRGTVFSLILLFALATVAHFRFENPVSRRLVGASVLAGISLLAATGVALAVDRFLSGAERGSSGGMLVDRVGAADAMGTSSRLSHWHCALTAATERPVAGHGPDAFAPVLFERQPAGTLVTYATHSHNLLTESLLAFGATGTLILVALLAHLVWQHRARILDPAWWPVTAMTVVLGVRSMLDLPLWFAHFLGIAATLAGLTDDRVRVLAPLASVPRVAVLGVVGAAGLLLAATLQAYVSMSGIWRERPPLVEMEARIMAAQKLPFFTAGGDSMRTHLPALTAAIAPRNLDVNSRSMEWRPHPRVVYRQVALLALVDREAEACALLERAHRVYPKYDDWFETLLTHSRTVRDPRLDRIRAVHARLRAGEPAGCGFSAASAAAAPAAGAASPPR